METNIRFDNLYFKKNIELLEQAIDGNIEMKKRVITPYQNEEIKVLEIKIPQLKYSDLIVEWWNRKIILIRAINNVEAVRIYQGKQSWYMLLNKSDGRYYHYFNKLLEEANL